MATTTTASQIEDAAAAVATAPGSIYIDTQHQDMVHDAQMDYYGAKLATCSSDRTIKIYNVSDSSYQLVTTLQGHQGPVWQLSWSHPRFGVLLASCSFDGSVLIHREVRPGDWTLLHGARDLHESSVNSLSFAPHEYGLLLAAASADGRVSILKHEADQTWTVDYINDCCLTGVNAVSWAPFGAYYHASSSSDANTDAAVDGPQPVSEPRLVTAGCDNNIRFWKLVDINRDGNNLIWQPDPIANVDTSTLSHTDWVRDVAWAPVLLPNHNVVASCGEDRRVIIWTQKHDNDNSSNNSNWTPVLLHEFEAPVWRVSWSVTGYMLAVSSGESDVSLWKQIYDDDNDDSGDGNGKWVRVSTVPDTGAATAAVIE